MKAKHFTTLAVQLCTLTEELRLCLEVIAGLRYHWMNLLNLLIDFFPLINSLPIFDCTMIIIFLTSMDTHSRIVAIAFPLVSNSTYSTYILLDG